MSGCTVHFMVQAPQSQYPLLNGAEVLRVPQMAYIRRGAGGVSSLGSLRRMPEQFSPRIVAVLKLREG